MYKVKVYTIGKIKENWLQEALAEYEGRLKASLSFEWILSKNKEQMAQLLEREANFICLDPQGREFNSEEFSTFLIKALQEGHSRLSFAIGGADGIPSSTKAKARSLVSLSQMTFTHQITRLILLEQVYRALEISKGTAYHK
jgi:23S rRNA (pseudouridine1915-N3)-methyltransferase